MKTLNKNTASKNTYTEKIIQFGEGNFLRAFVDWIVWKTNQKTDFDASVVVVQPRAGGRVEMLNDQDGLYHVNLQGLQNGQAVDSIELIDVISRGIDPYMDFEGFLRLAEQPEMRFVISNTTEAGITFDPACKFADEPALSYPGKLVQLLYHRYQFCNGDISKGFVILPCELIFQNGKHLRNCIFQYIDHWGLGEDFKNWVAEACPVYSTLVDRIVPGYPKDNAGQIMQRIGYDDRLIVAGEIYHLWVIEAPESLANEFPANKAGVNVLIVPSEAPYHERKVTLLNGPHTVLAPVGYLCGLDTVRQCCEDALVDRFVDKVMYHELLPTLNLPQEQLVQFADDVKNRFKNPYVKHFVTSIMLNSFSKFKTRDLPGLKTYLLRKGTLPKCIVLGLAAICTYYKGGYRGNDAIAPNDAPEIIQLLQTLWATNNPATVAQGVLAASDIIWDEDLNQIPGLTAMLTQYLEKIKKDGMREAVEMVI
ncbi:MAG: tagaturonate reductase [Bacteroidales bacterium]|nr:tagaturonate reductase [Bacteroidales bacterium]